VVVEGTSQARTDCGTELDSIEAMLSMKAGQDLDVSRTTSKSSGLEDIDGAKSSDLLGSKPGNMRV